MKLILKYLLTTLISILSISQFAFCQRINLEDLNIENFLEKNRTNIKKKNNSSEFSQLKSMLDQGQTLYPKVQFHQLRRSDGTGGYTEEEFSQMLDLVNMLFAESNIEFVSCSTVDYLDNDEMYEIGIDLTIGQAPGELPNWNQNGDVIDIYVEQADGEPFGFAGSSSVNIQIIGTQFGLETTIDDGSIGWEPEILGYPLFRVSGLAHELGHALSLRHTHRNGDQLAENASGSNCSIASDELCDTPADPRYGLGIASGDFVIEFATNEDCQFLLGDNFENVNSVLGTSLSHPTDEVDVSLFSEYQEAFYYAWKDTWQYEEGVLYPYDPPITNIMSYYASRCRSEFSDGQISKMRANLCERPALLYQPPVLIEDVHLVNTGNSPVVEIYQDETLYFSDFTITGPHHIRFDGCEIVFEQDFIIPEGAVILFQNCQVSFHECGLICDRGILLSSNSTFKAFDLLCGVDNKWDGIKATSMQDVSISRGDMALVNSTVQDAKMGVQLGDGSVNGITNSYPGFSFFGDVTFKDNNIDVFIDGNPDIHNDPESILNINKLEFYGCVFTDDEKIHENEASFKINGINNVLICNSTFEAVNQHAILSENSSFDLIGNETNWPYWPIYSAESLISGSTENAININSNGDHPISISGYEFLDIRIQNTLNINEVESIDLSNNYFATESIYFGEFDIVKIQGDSQFNVYDNQFALNTSTAGNAIHLENTGKSTNSIQNNQFEGLGNGQTAVLIEGANYDFLNPYNSGVELTCNSFNRFENAIVVNGSLSYDGIRASQGTQQVPANNKFINIGNSLLENNTSNAFRYYESDGLIDGVDITNETIPGVQIISTSSNNSNCSESANKNILVNESKNYSIIPNPANEFVTISNYKGEVNVIDGQGRVVQKFTLKEIGERIDVSNLSHGLYFISLVSSQEKNTFKLIIE